MESKLHKQKQLDALYEPYKKCVKCPLGFLGRTNVVFGKGNPDAHLMVIGEGPGEQEDAQAKPFVGRSGKLLDTVFELLSIHRDDIFITNIVKCRPPHNRKPFSIESSTCKSLLLDHQIEIIKPTVICTLGASALQGLLNLQHFSISKVRGSLLFYKSTHLIPTFHPAYILRNPKELQKLINDIAYAYQIAKINNEKSKNPQLY